MKYSEQMIGPNGSYVKIYLQEPTPEIDSQRIYPTIIVCPGGAYMWTSIREDEQVAMRFLSEGFHVIVLHYATEGIAAYKDSLPENPVTCFPNPLVDLASTVSLVRQHMKEWAVDEDFIVVGGFSAGGNLAAQLGTMWHEDWLEEKVGQPKASYRPTHLLLGYAALNFAAEGYESETVSTNTVLYAVTGEKHPSAELRQKMNPLQHVSHQTPETFIWHTVEDQLVKVQDALLFSLELDKYRVPYELHVFNKGKHGLVLGDLRTGVKASNSNSQVYKWVDLFLEWLYPHKSKLGGFYQEKEG